MAPGEAAARLIPGPRELVGTCRTFGPYGPAYQVRRIVREAENGDVVLELVVLETGEQVEALYSQVYRDPEAA